MNSQKVLPLKPRANIRGSFEMHKNTGILLKFENQNNISIQILII